MFVVVNTDDEVFGITMSSQDGAMQARTCNPLQSGSPALAANGRYDILSKFVPYFLRRHYCSFRFGSCQALPVSQRSLWEHEILQGSLFKPSSMRARGVFALASCLLECFVCLDNA